MRSPGGSVKRARQRAAGQNADTLRVTIDTNPVQIESPARLPSPGLLYTPYSSEGSRQPPIPFMPHMATTQRYPPMSPSESRSPGQRPNSPTWNNPTGRGPPPQRPPRPSFVPSMVDPSQRAQFTEQHHPEYWEGSPMSPPSQEPFSERYSSGSSRPTTGSTGSTGSSTGTIPDFPVPSPTMSSQPTRRIPNLGPPPSSRKGGATYYSQNSFVTPILEEQPESHNSYASSHVMPASWGDGAPDIYTEGGIEEEDEDGVGSSGRQSRAGDHDESTGLVRKVSIGRAGKPALKHIKSGEGLHDANSPEEPSPAKSRGGLGEVAAAAGDVGVSEALNYPRGMESDNSRMYAQLEDTSTVPAPLRPSAATSKGGSATTSGSRTPTTPLDPRVKQVLGGLEKGGALGPSGTSAFNTTSASMSEKGLKKPARLNLEAVRENDVRGSSSSLPELIRRATRLASNLDRGRTASRLGLLGMLEEKERANRNRSPRGSHPGSISEILAAFPSPSIATPTGEGPGSRWPSPKQRSGLSRSHTAAPGSPTSYDKHRSRKCCGMPIWAFALLTIILILLIAAAVIIPVTLIVLPKHGSSNAPASVAACTSTAPCSHGGTNVLISDSCRCICSNGFTGSTCTVPADKLCTSTDITFNGTNYRNATLGSSIPRLLSAATTNFSLTLNGQILLSLFSAQNLSCNYENALVNFDGSSQKRALPINLHPEAIIEAAAPVPLFIPPFTLSPRHSTHTLAERLVSSILPNTASASVSDAPSPTAAGAAAVTSNGIVYAASGLSTPSSPQSTSASSSSSSPSSPTSNTKSIVTPLDFDFARIAVLFILQEKDLNTAVSAQEKLQMALKGAEDGKSGQGYNMSGMDAGQSIVVDFTKFTVDFGNGTVFGGGPALS